MASSLSDAEWIIGGNFNMVEREADQGGSVGTIVKF